MPHDVRQALLHNPIDRQTLHVAGHRLDRADELNAHRVLAPIVRDQLLQCRRDSQLIQCRRTQLHRETPQPRKRICRFVTDRKQRLLHIFIVRLIRECTQGKEQCRQRLPALVVQLHCNSLTLLLLRCHDMPQEAAALLRSLTQMPLHIVHRIR